MSDPATSQQAAPSSSTSSATTGTLSSDNAHLHPPFPPKGVSPAPHSPSAVRQPEHPYAQDVINAAATHTMPEHPAPNVQSPGEGEKDVTREGLDQRHLGDQHHHHQTHHLSPQQRSQRIAEEVDKDDSEHPPKSDEVVKRAARKVDDEDEASDSSQEDRDPDQQPLIKGTPLDELKTPMFERPGRGMLSRNATATAGQPGLRLAQDRIDENDVASPGRSSAGAGCVDETATAIAGKAQRPGFGAGKEMGSIRMGASALVSALNAVPWEDDSGEDSESSDDEAMARGSARGRPNRPQVSRLHSSLHTIRPMQSPRNDEGFDMPDQPRVGSYFPAQGDSQTRHGQSGYVHRSLNFPYRQNAVARKARSPGPTELAYQFAGRPAQTVPLEDIPPAVIEEPGPRRASNDSTITSSTVESEGGLPAGLGRDVVAQQVEKEGQLAEQEEGAEIIRADEEDTLPSYSDSSFVCDISSTASRETQQDENVGAALREGTPKDEVVEDLMAMNPQEKKRVRREMLAERLREVFGLDEREEVLEEMRCWLLRSVMLKGYMYLTPRHICFFAKMPDKENLIVKTGPLSKKNSRTKMYTKYWAVLKNDVLSWYESTADPYFPKGNVSLQYALSCDPADETRFKLRTSERSYTFTADTEASRDEWIKSIQKVIFKTQHEGESVKLIIPVHAIYEIEKSPTLEFAETIEVKCVDPEDQMSMDSYFFASFQDSERAMSSIQRVLDERSADDMPRPASPGRIASYQSEDHPRKEDDAGPLGLKKLGSVLKPLMSRSSDKTDDTAHSSDDGGKKFGLSIPFMSKHKPSHDSLETLHVQDEAITQPEEGDWDGYPPRQAGQPPRGMGEEKGWGGWIKKPSKIFGTSPSSSTLHGKSPSGSSAQFGKTPPGAKLSTSPGTTRTGRGKRESVTEVVEPLVDDSDSGDSSGEEDTPGGGPRMSFGSESSMGLGRNSQYSLMERSESNQMEEDETARKFRSVFSLPEKEELVDHFPGCLYRVLPVSGRFFVSTNYFCFRSSQLLYKTKMIIPIRDLYGLKAQKAFRPGHSGLIIVIKGHEELFLEFTSNDRRAACVSLLEERMEAVRLRSHPDAQNPISPGQSSEDVAMRIMEDLDESAPLEARTKELGTPSMMFGSTTSTFLEFKPEPMRITCLTIGSRGDVQPYIALCKGLQAEGHHTRIASHGEYKDWVEGHGIEFASVGGDPAELMAMCVDNGMFTYSFMKEGLQKFRGWLDDLLTSSWEACQGSELLIESPSAMGGIHIAEALRIPYYRAFTMPWTRTRAYPHAFAVPEHKRGGAYNYMTYTMFDQVFWRAIAGQVNRFRRKVLGIESTNFDKLEQHKVPFLYNFSPNVVPPPLDWTEWIHVTGYWFLENADESAKKDKEYSPPEGIVEFIDKAHNSGKKVVYIGFGSIVVSDPEEMTRCVVDAVVESGVCAILSKGWSDRGAKNKGEEKGDSEGADGVKYPDEIFPIDSIDHTWLFPRIDAACHHGGAGSSGASLRAGIPTIIKPFFGDQAFWSERVESLNVGSAVRKLTSEALAEALVKATTDEKQIAKAKVVGEMIRKENGVSKAIEAIYRDLEYAKSLIKPAPSEKVEQKTLTGLLPSISSDVLHLTKSKSHPRDHSVSRVKEEDGEEVSDSSWDVLSEDHDQSAVGGQDDLTASPEQAVGHHRSGSDASFSSGKTAAKGRFSAGGLLGKVREKVIPS